MPLITVPIRRELLRRELLFSDVPRELQLMPLIGHALRAFRLQKIATCNATNSETGEAAHERSSSAARAEAGKGHPMRLNYRRASSTLSIGPMDPHTSSA